MFNVNFTLAKALQQDMLRTAKQDRLARQINENRKKLAALLQKKAKPQRG